VRRIISCRGGKVRAEGAIETGAAVHFTIGTKVGFYGRKCYILKVRYCNE
jgi:hypothetical protein